MSPNTVARVLREELGLTRRQAAKSLCLGESPDRNAQFERIAELKAEYLEKGWPVLSIDTKKKELLGDFFRPGRGWTDGLVKALDHDFPGAGASKVIWRPTPSAAGGCGWGRSGTGRPRGCSCWPTPGGATAGVWGCSGSGCARSLAG